MDRQATVKRHSPSGQFRDEGGTYDVETVPVPAWVHRAQKHCPGCHDNFYNGRVSCTGNTWCWSLKPEYARRETRPDCYH